MYRVEPMEIIENPLASIVTGDETDHHNNHCNPNPKRSYQHHNANNMKRHSASALSTPSGASGPLTVTTTPSDFNVPSGNNDVVVNPSSRSGRVGLSQSQSHHLIGHPPPSGQHTSRASGTFLKSSGGDTRNRHSSGSLLTDPLLASPSPEPGDKSEAQKRIQDDGFCITFLKGSEDGSSAKKTKNQKNVITNSSRTPSPMMLTPLNVNNDTSTSPGGDETSTTRRSPTYPLDEDEADRETWSQGLDFLLSIIGFAVDLANVWRFPYFCYKNGGGAFLIPYFMMLALSAIPVFYMELLLGQSIRQGPISMWKICPIFKGIGYCAVTVSYFVSFYYNTIMGWSLHFTVNSFSSPLPWTTCNNSWNTKDCFIPESTIEYDYDVETLVLDGDYSNSTTSLVRTRGQGRRVVHRPPNATSPASEYFRNSVLEMGDHNIDNLGKPKLDLLVCLAIIYCLLYVILFRGIRSTGKVVWLTATLPYGVMLILLIRGLMLEGASDGIYYYLVPNMTKLKEVGVWSDAAKQIFFSSGAGFGVHLTYASYNNFHNNCFRDCMVTSLVNAFTSIFAGFVIFTFLGSMAYRQGRPIEEVVNVGPGLVFEVYPEAVGTLPGANFWSLLFFLMLIMLGIDSAMGGLECVITGITDEFKVWFKRRKHGRELFMFVIVFISFLISMVNITRGGMYTFTFFDTYAAGSSLLFAVLFEVLAVSWVYGLDQLCKDAEAMLGFAPGIYWRVCWKYVSPLLITVIIILDLSTALPLSYDGYEYPGWAQLFGYIFTFIPITLVPILAIIEYFKFPGDFRTKLGYAITPTIEHAAIKERGYVKRFKLSHWINMR